MLSEGTCPLNPLFHHGAVRQGEFCQGCGSRRDLTSGNKEPINTVRELPITGRARSIAKSLPGPDDEVIGLDDDVTPRAKKGLYVPSTQTQVPIQSTSTEAERAYTRTVVNSARQQSLQGRTQPPGRTTTKGSTHTKKYFFEIQLWLVRYSTQDIHDIHDRTFLSDESRVFRTYTYLLLSFY